MARVLRHERLPDILKRMKKRPEVQESLTLSEAQGPWSSVGVGMVPVGGFRLRSGLRPWGSDGEASDTAQEEWLSTDGGEGRRYAISLQADDLTKPSIARRFERLGENPSPARVLAFASRHGFLATPETLIDSDRNLRTHPLSESDLKSGERLAFWQEEAARFRDLRETWRRLHDLNDGGPQRQHDAHAYLAKRVRWSPSGHAQYRSEIETRTGTFSFTRWVASATDIQEGALADRFHTGDLVGPARLYLHRVVNEQLRDHVSPAVPAFLERPAMRLFPDSLLGAIYFRFALDLVSPDSRDSVCDHCHMPFAQGRKDKVFCSKNCKENARYRRVSRGTRRSTRD
jgi:hypothetical protein